MGPGKLAIHTEPTVAKVEFARLLNIQLECLRSVQSASIRRKTVDKFWHTSLLMEGDGVDAMMMKHRIKNPDCVPLSFKQSSRIILLMHAHAGFCLVYLRAWFRSRKQDGGRLLLSSLFQSSGGYI